MFLHTFSLNFAYALKPSNWSDFDENLKVLEEDLKKGGTTTVGQLAAMTCAQVEALTHALFNMPFVLGEATAGFETSKRGDRPQRFEGTSEQAEDEGPSGGGDDLHRGGGEDQG